MTVVVQVCCRNDCTQGNRGEGEGVTHQTSARCKNMTEARCVMRVPLKIHAGYPRRLDFCLKKMTSVLSGAVNGSCLTRPGWTLPCYARLSSNNTDYCDRVDTHAAGPSKRSRIHGNGVAKQQRVVAGTFPHAGLVESMLSPCAQWRDRDRSSSSVKSSDSSQWEWYTVDCASSDQTSPSSSSNSSTLRFTLSTGHRASYEGSGADVDADESHARAAAREQHTPALRAVITDSSRMGRGDSSSIDCSPSTDTQPSWTDDDRRLACACTPQGASAASASSAPFISSEPPSLTSTTPIFGAAAAGDGQRPSVSLQALPHTSSSGDDSPETSPVLPERSHNFASPLVDLDHDHPSRNEGELPHLLGSSEPNSTTARTQARIVHSAQLEKQRNGDCLSTIEEVDDSTEQLSATVISDTRDGEDDSELGSSRARLAPTNALLTPATVPAPLRLLDCNDALSVHSDHHFARPYNACPPGATQNAQGPIYPSRLWYREYRSPNASSTRVAPSLAEVSRDTPYQTW